MASDQTRNCDTCGLPLPLTATHYDRKRDAPDGFRTTCKVCRKEAREREATGLATKDDGAAGDMRELTDSLDLRSLRTLQRLSADQVSGAAIPDEAEFLQELTKRFGGASGWADHMMATFLAAPVGSQRRLAILREVGRHAHNVTEQKKTSVSLVDMDQDDLDAMAERLQEEIRQRRQARSVAPLDSRVIDVPAQHAEQSHE